MRSPDPHGPLRLSDEQWATITKHVALPPAARSEIESSIDRYWMAKRFRDKKPSAEEVRSRLQKVAEATQRMKSAIGALTDAEVTELRTSNFYWGPESEWPNEELEAHIRGMLGSLADQAAAVENLIEETSVNSARYSRKSPKHVDGLIQHLGPMLERHGGPPLSRGKPVLSMLMAVFRIADPSVTQASVEEAIKRLPGKRGGLPT